MKESEMYENGIQAVFENYYDITSNSNVTNLKEMHKAAETLGFFEERYKICLEIEEKQGHKGTVDNLVNTFSGLAKAMNNLVGKEDDCIIENNSIGDLHD